MKSNHPSDESIPDDASVAVIRFEPQVWARLGWNRDVVAFPSGEHDPDTFEIPIEDALVNGRLVEDYSRESDKLRTHENAPTWVQEYSGPFNISINELR